MMKKIGITLLVLIALLSGVLFWLNGNLDHLLRVAIAEYGSEMTQAKVTVGGVKVNATNGEGTITNLSIGNAKGFKTPYAFRVKEFSIIVDPTTVAGDVVVVRKIAIIAPDVIYEKGEAITNFDAIQKNIADYLGPSESDSAGKKFIVEMLTIRNINAQASASFMNGETVAVKLQDLTLKNIGKSQGGITSGELGQVIAGALKKRLSGTISFDKLGKLVGDTAGAATKTAKDAMKKAIDLF